MSVGEINSQKNDWKVQRATASRAKSNKNPKEREEKEGKRDGIKERQAKFESGG